LHISQRLTGLAGLRLYTLRRRIKQGGLQLPPGNRRGILAV